MTQKATNTEYKSGLTPFQEKAAALLVSGKTITDTAIELKVSRATIYRLMQNGLFEAFYNLLCSEAKMSVKSNLFTLQEKAFKAITDALDSDNDATRLKAGMWVVDKIQEVEIGNTNPIVAIENECWEGSYVKQFNDEKFESLKSSFMSS